MVIVCSVCSYQEHGSLGLRDKLSSEMGEKTEMLRYICGGKSEKPRENWE